MVGWRELHAGDGARAFAFYAGQFGWKKERDHDMRPLGVYHVFDAGDGQRGGIFTETPQTPSPFWLYYFNVDAIDAAVERVKAHGGKVVNWPMETPNGQWIRKGSIRKVRCSRSSRRNAEALESGGPCASGGRQPRGKTARFFRSASV